VEGIAVLVVLAVCGVTVVLPIWLIVAVLDLRRRATADHQENTQHWSDVTARLFRLEEQIKELKRGAPSPAPSPSPETEAAEIAAAEIPPPNPVSEVPARPAAVEPPLVPPQVRPPTRAPEAPKAAPPPPSIPAIPAPPPKPVAPPVVQARITPPVAVPYTKAAPREEHPASGIDLEEMLGTRWLIKIGIGLIVLGLAFFLAFELQKLGPAGKVLLGVGLSAVMIAAGVRYESNERYRILARASAAGGWALLFFVSYAVYHVPAARIIDSRELDFLLMLVVAGAIVWYSLRYKSQTTTALAFVLTYLTVGIHHASVYSLGADVIMVLTVVALALRMNWFALEVFGILATYFNHFLWVSPRIEAMGPVHFEFPEFRTSVALLAFYWFVFRLSYIFRHIANENDERLSTASALLNGTLLLALLRYQSIHPEWAFWALLVLGSVELVLAALAARRRRTAFVVLATLGSALLIAAPFFRYSGSDLSLLWLVAAETFFLAGVFTREIVFRRMGMLTMILVSLYMVLVTGAPFVESRLSANPLEPDIATAILFAAAALLFYFNSHGVRQRWKELFSHEFDAAVIAGVTYLGGVLALLAVWFAFPDMWTAVGWAALALLLDVAAERWQQPALAIQGNLVAVAAVLRLVTLNIFSHQQWNGFSFRVITVIATAVLLYVASLYAGAALENVDRPGSSVLAAGHTWAASIILAILALYELAPLNVAVAWMLGGLVLLEVGLQPKVGFVRRQGYTALAAAFVRVFLVNLYAHAVPGQLSTRLTTVLPLVAAFFYTDWRLRRASASDAKSLLRQAGTFFTWLGTITLAALLYFEIREPWVAASWAALALGLMLLAQYLKRGDYLYQAFLMAFAVAFRVVTYNFSQPDLAAGVLFTSQTFYVGLAITLLAASLYPAFAMRRSGAAVRIDFPPARRPEQVFFFVAFALLTALIALESTRGQLTLTWGAEGVAVFLFALVAGERSFRLSGLGLLLVCVAKILFLDVWGLESQVRYITLIGLGGALVLVSYLYTRYKEKFRQYL